MVRFWKSVKLSIVVYIGILIALTPIFVRMIDLAMSSKQINMPLLLHNGELFLIAISQLYFIVIAAFESKHTIFGGFGILTYTICMCFYIIGLFYPNSGISLIYYSSIIFIIIICIMVVCQKYIELAPANIVQKRKEDESALTVKVKNLQGAST